MNLEIDDKTFLKLAKLAAKNNETIQNTIAQLVNNNANYIDNNINSNMPDIRHIATKKLPDAINNASVKTAPHINKLALPTNLDAYRVMLLEHNGQINEFIENYFKSLKSSIPPLNHIVLSNTKLLYEILMYYYLPIFVMKYLQSKSTISTKELNICLNVTKDSILTLSKDNLKEHIEALLNYDADINLNNNLDKKPEISYLLFGLHNSLEAFRIITGCDNNKNILENTINDLHLMLHTKNNQQ